MVYAPTIQSEALKNIKKLAEKINSIIKNNIIKKEFSVENQVIKKTIERADKLFEGIKDVHSEEGLKDIVGRYSKDKNYYSIGIINNQ